MAIPWASTNPIPIQHKWNTIIKRKLLSGDCEGCIITHTKMQVEAGLLADNYAFPVLLKAATYLSSPSLGYTLHSLALKTGYCSHLFVQTALINMYSSFGSSNNARKMFDNIQHRDVMAWNSILAAYANCGMMDMCLELFGSMPIKDQYSYNIMISGCASTGRVDSARQIFESSAWKDDFSWNSMISCYVKAGDMDTAVSVFDEMPQKNEISWNIIIAGYLKSEQYAVVVKKFDDMRSCGLTPSDLAMSSAIAASAHLGSLKLGSELHLQAQELGISSSSHVAAALIDMYAKSGNVERAVIVFYKAEKRDVYLWNSMISGLAAHGHGKASIKLFEDMKQHRVEPDDITFIGLLTACSHSGLVSEGFGLFNCMHSKYGVSPNLEHYACLVDLLSRAGELDRAHRIVKEMPFMYGASVLGALLMGCVMHRNVEIGMEVGKLIAERGDAMRDGEYMMLAHMYSVAGCHEEARRWRDMMREKGVNKEAGFSMIEVDGMVYRFLSGNMNGSSFFY